MKAPTATVSVTEDQAAVGTHSKRTAPQSTHSNRLIE